MTRRWFVHRSLEALANRSKQESGMAAKMLAFDAEARKALLEGVTKLARAVKAPLGARGRNAVVDKGRGSPNIADDGVTVAEDNELREKYDNLDARLAGDAAHDRQRGARARPT